MTKYAAQTQRNLKVVLVTVGLVALFGQPVSANTWIGDDDGLWATDANWEDGAFGLTEIKPGPGNTALFGSANAVSQLATLDSQEVTGVMTIRPSFHLSLSNGDLNVMGNAVPFLNPRIFQSTVDDGGEISGYGSLAFDTHPDAPAAELPFVNSGRIAPRNGTLTLTATDRPLDLDGPLHTGNLSVNDFSIFEPRDGVGLNVIGAVEPFSGSLTIGQRDTARFESLTLGDATAPATVSINPNYGDNCLVFAQAACTATFATDDLTIQHSGTEISVLRRNGSGTGIFSGNVQFLEGSLNVADTMTARFNDHIHFGQSSNTNVEGNGYVRISSTSLIETGATFDGGGNLFVAPTGSLDLTEDVSADVKLLNNGLIDLRSTGSGAHLTASRGFNQASAGEIRFELGGAATNFYDQLHVENETATLDGTATVALTPGYQPSAGDEFTILTSSAGINGQFANLDLPALPSGLIWETNYTPNSLKLSVTGRAQTTGDFNNDGDFDCTDIDALTAQIIAGTNDVAFDLTADGLVTLADQNSWLSIAGGQTSMGDPFLTGNVDFTAGVNSTDLGTLLNNFGDSNAPGYCSGNLDADMNVDSGDLGLLLNNFGQGNNAPLASAVPEPQTHLLILLFSLLVFRRLLETSRK